MRIASLRLHWLVPSKLAARRLEASKASNDLWGYGAGLRSRIFPLGCDGGDYSMNRLREFHRLSYLGNIGRSFSEACVATFH
ncbi:hypothetical protein BDN71DRAFT_687044 [Pleurotus eryngii]|uniref:Uncharacterized protein n=1 Tax=Pleurotus eryngii TaxID=5323 RepID=A0A9P5ZZF8_PLEER|nr:hypothetical protein BDN71DRAFT_687044 [Pleurotus eryngii]